jgi:hypothetical protein
MVRINPTLMRRLEKKGFGADAIPGFIRNVANNISQNRSIGLLEINRKLQFLGWESIELDYHTLQLIIARLEAEEYTGD